ncbi:MAG: BspA family leucine-rich repeat surface protein, partial [Candidatus Saccharibacteria bacterium]|nr:BspA family leucine-rich repeat surface protein [Candidatus Saccharibacteria bacterium]
MFKIKKQMVKYSLRILVPFSLLSIFALPALMNTPVHALSSSDFVTTWKTDNPGVSNSTSITVPMIGVDNYSVDWNNDGIFDETGLNGSTTHDFGSAGTYTIRISAPTARIYFGNNGDKDKILNISQWGTTAWTDFSDAFSGCSHIDVTATDSPDLSQATSLASMFRTASSLVGNSSFNNWNTSTITDLGSIFFNDPLFNQDISGWNTSNVTSMGQMFQGASTFNQDISGWNTSKLTSAYYMFADAIAFNQDISGWNVSKVETFTGMFVNDPLFNQDISGWNTSSATNFSWMFSNTTLFNQNIGGWNTSKVTDMSYMFYVSQVFNQDISGWDTSKVTDMSYMFTYNAIFNQNITGWDTSKVTDMSYMFKQAYGLNQNLGLWDVTSVTNMTDMFKSVTLPTATYDAILMGWSAETLKNNVTFNAGNSRYCAVEARDAITTNYSWTIQDGGPSICDTSNDVTLTTTDGIDVIKEGSTGYQTTQTITNNGPLSVDTINFSLDQNDCISITSTSNSGDATTLGSITSQTWTGLLETGQTLTITYNADITCSGGSTITFDNPITSMAYIGFTLTDTNSSNNSDSVDQTLILGVDLSITTTDNLDDILENSTGYQTTQTITNNGP